MSVYYGDNPPRYERTETDYQRTPAHYFIRENIFINKKTYQGQDDTTTRGRSIGVVVKITKISRLPEQHSSWYSFIKSLTWSKLQICYPIIQYTSRFSSSGGQGSTPQYFSSLLSNHRNKYFITHIIHPKKFHSRRYSET